MSNSNKQGWVAALLTGLSLSAVVSANPVPAYQGPAATAPRQEATAELLMMVEQLKDEVRTLRGLVDEQGHRLNQLNRQARDRYVDLDQRLLDLNGRVQGLETAGSAPAPAPAAGDAPAAPDAPQGQTATPPAPGAPATTAAPAAARKVKEYRAPSKEEEAQYQAIRALITSKSYDKAIDEIYQFVARYPDGDLTVNAYYWLGEVYLVKPQLEQAKQAFTVVATRYADHRKASDASYKLGVVHDRMGQKQEAERLLKAVMAQYPGTQAAGLAKTYLDGLGR